MDVTSGEPDAPTMIRLSGVGKTYPDGTVAVHELDLDVRRGELVVLVGPSGCGKSTTLKMINRLIEPTTGTIEIDGEDVTRQDPVKLRRVDRLRHPADRAVPAPEDRHQRDDRAAAVRRDQGDRARARARADDAGRAGPGHVRRPLPAPALRWSAAAGRGGPGAGRGPAGAADGRAVRRGRPGGAGAAAGRVPAASSASSARPS